MDEVTQQNAALVEEAAAAAESMEEQAQSLAEAVSVFLLDESASGRGQAKRIAAPRSAPAKAAQKLAAKPKSGAEEDEWAEF